MANTPISNLPVATALSGSEQIPIVQAGTTSRTTTGAIAGLANNVSIATGPGLTGGPITSTGTIRLIAPVAVSLGGTGLITTPVNGALLIGNGTGYSSATLTAGANVAITNGAGTITIATTGGSGTVTGITAGTGLNGGTITTSGTINVATTGVAANSYGSASSVPTYTVNAQGQLTAASNTAIAIASGAVSGLAASATTDTTNAANITSGTLPSGRIAGSYSGINGVGTLTSGAIGTGFTAIPYSALASIATGSLLGNFGTASASPSAVTVGTGLTLSAGGTLSASGGSGTVTSVSVAGGTTGLSTTGGPVTTSGTITLAGTLAVGSGGTGVTASSGANSVVLRDANSNVTANALLSGYTNFVAAGTTTVLTAASVFNWVVTGSGGQTYQLPSALTLPVGASFTFNNNQTSGTIAVNNNSATLVVSVPSGGYVTVTLLTNSLAAGTWDVHYQAPSNVSWSTNTFNVPASITGATWNGNVVGPLYGGTGVANNGTNTITLAGPLTHAGAFSQTFTATGTTSLTLPTSGTITALGNVTTGSGSIVLATTPTITSPIIGITSFADYWQPAGSSATQATVAFQALGTDTNINVSLTPKGTGAIIAGPIPDGTATGGNARGANAIDLQTSRTAATQVATGANSVAIGNRNTAGNQYDIAIGFSCGPASSAYTDAICIGRSCYTIGNYAIAIGYNAQSTSSSSVAIGPNAYCGNYFQFGPSVAIGSGARSGNSGSANNFTAIGPLSQVNTNSSSNVKNSSGFGYQSWVDNVTAKIAFGTGSITTQGDSQFSNVILRGSTTATTAAVLTADLAAATTYNIANMPINSAFYVKIRVVGRETAAGSVTAAAWTIESLVVCGATSATIAIVGTPVITTIGIASAWAGITAPTLGVDTTNRGLTVTVTPYTVNATHWIANVEATEVW